MLPSDSKELTLSGITDFFASLLNGGGQTAPTTSERALQSFLAYCTGKNISGQSDFFTIATDWVVALQMGGVALGTVARYLKGLSGYYTKAVKENLAPPTPYFRDLTDRLKQNGEEMWSGSITRQDFEKFLTLTKVSCRPLYEENVAADIILFSLINGQMPLHEVAMLKVDDRMELNEESRAIINRHREPARRYVFPLRQSLLTKRQLNDALNRLVMAHLQRRNIRCFATADETLRSYWGCAALRAGVAPRMVSSVLGTAPQGLKMLSLFPQGGGCEVNREEMNASVAAIFLSNPLQWYAMRLRTRVSFADLKMRFMQLKDELQTPELFYPCEEITKRTGKKLVVESKPVIGNIVFFRARITDILPLFYRIGDLAWCYKYTNESGSAYAAISKDSFRQFQQAIGHFTSDYEVAPIGGLKPGVNDRVVVIGGPFQGINAVIQDINTQNENTIYRLHFIGDNGIDYRLSVDSRMVRKG